MADKTFVLEFRQVTTGDGAQKLVEDINRVKALTDNVTDGAAQAPNALDPLVKSADELTEKIPLADREIRRFVDATKDLDKNYGNSFSGLKGGIESLLTTMRNGGPTIGSFAGALRSAASVAGAGAAAGVGAVVSATAAVTVALVAATVKASKAIADFILEKEKLRDGVANFNFDRLENAKLTFEKQIAAMDRMIERVKLYTDLANSALQAQSKLDQSERNMRMAQAESESAKTVAASGGDATVVAAEAAKLAALKASLDAEERKAKATDVVTTAQRNHRAAMDELAAISQRIRDNEQTRERTQLSLSEIAKKLTDNVSEQQRLAESTAAIDAEISKLKEDERDSRRGQLLAMMKKGAEMRDESQAGLEKDRPAEMAASERVSTTRIEQQAAENDLAAAVNLNTAEMTKSGMKYGEATRDIGFKIAEVTAKLAEAKGSLAVAQGSTGAPASGAEQTDAYNKVMQIEQELARLRQLQEQASREVSDSSGRFGESFTTGARSVQAASASAAAAVDGAGQKITATTQVATNAVSAAAERVVQATAEGVGGIADGMTKVGTAVNATADRVVSGLDGIARTLEQRLADIDRRISTVDAVAKSASRQAEIATSQIANQR